MILLWLWLAQASMREDDTPHPVTVVQMWTTAWSHVCVQGLVTYKAHEDDKDWHLRIEDGRGPDKPHFMIAEIIPQLPMELPKVGEQVEVCGITRYDKKHKWPEVHPVISLRALPGTGKG